MATFYSDNVPHLPLWVKILIVLLALWMIYHRWRELSHNKSYAVFAAVTANLLTRITLLDFNSSGTKATALADFFKTAFSDLETNVFRKAGKVKFCIMIPEGNNLKALHPHEDREKYSASFRLEIGKSGAGVAFEKDVAVYIPAIRYKQGISISFKGHKAYELEDSVYSPSQQETSKSILCIPISTESSKVGVLNIDSVKQDAFGEIDFDIANVIARTFALVFDKYGPSL